MVFLNRFPVMLRQQQCWKFGCVMRNIDTLLLRKLGCQNAPFTKYFETHQLLYYKAKCVGAKFVSMTMDFEWRWVVRYSTTARLCDEASCCSCHTVQLVVIFNIV
jgi:hypothetical protein